MSYLEEEARRIRDHVPAGVTYPDRADDLFLLYAVLARAKGLAVTPADVHDAWTAWMAAHDGAHRSRVPFEDLTPDVRAADEPFVEAIHAAVRARPR